jgi:hypothetical protein
VLCCGSVAGKRGLAKRKSMMGRRHIKPRGRGGLGPLSFKFEFSFPC